MTQAARPKPMTFEEAALLDPDTHRGEIDDGTWVPTTNSTWRHGEIVLAIGFLLKVFAKANPGFSVSVGDPGTKLQRDPDRLRAPDIGVIRSERQPTGRGSDGWLEGAPDFVVEVIGDSQTATDLSRKALEYLAAGAKMVWVVDGDRKAVLVFSPPDHVRIAGEDDTLDASDALPGFSCRVADLFEP